MSLYNALFGVNQAAPLLLAMLGIDEDAIPRFRDCYLSDGRIAIHTRTGGGNRDYYEHPDRCRENYPEYFDGKDDPRGPWNCNLRKLPGFQYDADDGFDATYATFYFDVPRQFRQLLEKIPEGEDPAKRWQDTFAALNSATPNDPRVKKCMEVMEPLLTQIKDTMDKGDGGTVAI